MIRAAIYVRVSTEEQKRHGLSVDAQLIALKEYCKENNYKIVGVYDDAGLSASTSFKKRVALLKLVEDCHQQKIDIILFTKLDRWFRSVPDYYEVQRHLDDCKVPWKCIWEDYETETSSGRFKVNIMLSIAQAESDRTSERIKDVFEYKRTKGEALNGSAATGYIYKDGKWYKDEKTQECIDAFFKTYLSTFNKQLAMSKSRELGLRLSEELARNILYSDKYCGVYPYITESYITKEQHELILAHKPRCCRNNKYSYIFSGLLKCGKCGRSLSGSTSTRKRKNGDMYKFPMYVCDYGRRCYDCEGSAISEVKLESILLATIEDRLDEYNIKTNFSGHVDNTAKIRKCEDRLNRIKILFEMGDIEISEYKSKRDAILDDIDILKMSNNKKPIHLDSDWKDIYNSLDIKHRNSFWSQLIDYIVVPEKRAKEVDIFFK